MNFNINNTNQYEYLALQLHTALCLVNISAKRKTHSWEDTKARLEETADLQQNVFNTARALQDFEAEYGGSIFEPDQPDFITPKIIQHGKI